MNWFLTKAKKNLVEKLFFFNEELIGQLDVHIQNNESKHKHYIFYKK